MSDARDEQEPRPPSWRALITELLIALVMTTITVTTYVSAQHAVVARDLPGQLPAFYEQAAKATGTHLGVVPGIVASVLIAAYGRLMWWRGGKRRRPISPEEEGGIAAIPPA
ncbi:hypothetical protein ABZZ74_33985 [Streptomyces sp. NPDC006476]|uniref:hypothetical protein n=1 Tax=Streptomyces sp. NPDC006476 TaxID=3157175 RepID=UPI0033B3975C